MLAVRGYFSVNLLGEQMKELSCKKAFKLSLSICAAAWLCKITVHILTVLMFRLGR
jgi:hypothetical protein